MSKPQRRKGNAKAASSANAANLLGQSVPFFGFDGGVANVFDVAHDEPGSNIAPDIVLVLKKLTKKDPQTREKGLRELFDITNERSVEELDPTYQYFAPLFQKLVLDGSSTVRATSLKVTSSFISKLKKLAAKSLPEIIPFVMIAFYDLSAATASQASMLINECFPGEKGEKVRNLFSDTIISTCIDIVMLKHHLVPPQIYDDEESKEQREGRLTAQALQVLCKFCSSEISEKSSSLLNDFFSTSNNACLKRLLKSTSITHAHLLSLSLVLKDPVESLLESPLVAYAINSIDSEDSALCSSSFNILLKLLQDERYYGKHDVRKGVVPKFLNVLRKKNVHWRHSYHFILPTFAVLAERLGSDAANFVENMLESFFFNLPFEVSGLMSYWTTAICECLRFIFSKWRSEDGTKFNGVKSVFLVSIIIKLVNEVLTLQSDCYGVAVAFIHWFVEKEIFATEHQSNLFNDMQLNLVNKRPESDPFITALVEPCLSQLRSLHNGIIRGPNVPTSFLSCLDAAKDDYFLAITKECDIISVLCEDNRSFSASEAKPCSNLVIKLLSDSNVNKIITAPIFIHVLVTAASECDETWNSLKEKIPDFNKNCSTVLEKLLSNDDLSSVLVILNRFKVTEREEFLSDFLKRNLLNANVLSNVIQKIEMTKEFKEGLAAEILNDYIMQSSRGAVAHDDVNLAALSVYSPPKSVVEQAISNAVKAHSGDSHFGSETALRLADGVVRLLNSSIENYDGLIASTSFTEATVSALDEKLMNIEGPSVSHALIPNFGEIVQVDEDSLKILVQEILLNAMVVLNIIHNGGLPEKLRQRSLAFLAITRATITVVENCDKHGQILSPDDEYEDIQEDIVKLFGEGENASLAAAALCRLPYGTSSPTVFMAIRILCQQSGVAKESVRTSFSSSDLPFIIQLASRLDSAMKDSTVDPCERWLARYHHDGIDHPADYLNLLQEFVETNAPDWQEKLFSCSTTDRTFFQLTICALAAAKESIARQSTVLTAAAQDFMMCGIVSTMDSLDEACSAELPSNIDMDILLSEALDCFTACSTVVAANSDSDNKRAADFVKEWKDFFEPSLCHIVLRLWTLVKPDRRLTPGLRSLCAAVSAVQRIPDDLPLRSTFTPELDSLKYDASLQTIILSTQKCVELGCFAVQFAARHVLKMLSPIMYRHENGEWNDDEEVSSSGPRKAKIPFVILQMMAQKIQTAAFIGLECALSPLQTCIVSQEEHVAYCDAFSSNIDGVLSQLISACNDDCSRRNVLSQALSEEDLQLSKRKCLEDLLQTYRCNLLYRTFDAIPAVIRSWYNSLPSNASAIVNRFVTSCCSKLLIENELWKVKKANREQLSGEKLLKIRVVPVAGEVFAEYLVEETTMKLTITMPSNWPLSPPVMDLDKAIVPSDRVKKWLLQLKSYVEYQNGSIVEGILQWRKNVDRDVEGAEACTICMMTIHMNSHQLPKVKCRQCKNKFHSNCLYKWFESSNQSSCPLCRNNFT